MSGQLVAEGCAKCHWKYNSPKICSKGFSYRVLLHNGTLHYCTCQVCEQAPEFHIFGSICKSLQFIVLSMSSNLVSSISDCVIKNTEKWPLPLHYFVKITLGISVDR